MKIRIISLCLLFLVSLALCAQDKRSKKEREKARAKEAASQPIFLERLVVRSGQTYVIQGNELEVGTLILEDKANIALTQPNTMIFIDQATVGKKCYILGVGKKGKDGANGADGLANIVPGKFVDGRPGQKGSNGGDGLNLKLFIGDISFLSPLTIKLNGGKGGNGGNGGNGGTITKSCKDGRQGRGFNGGDSGRVGSGGQGGKLILLLSNNDADRAIRFKQTNGLKGAQGKPGLAGKIIRKCGVSNISTTTGNPGKVPMSFITNSGPIDDVNFISFPDPHPTPSAIVSDLPIKLKPGATIGDVNDKLSAALTASGYDNVRYYCVDEGFAVVTGIEHVNSKGVPLPESDRFSGEEALFNKEFTLKNLISAMFMSNKSYSRIIVFMVTNKIHNPSPELLTRKEAISWFRSSLTDLPDSTAALPYTNEHKVSALIYEFSKNANGKGVIFSTRALIPINDHLYGARLLPRLTDN